MRSEQPGFKPDCRACPRLARFLDEVRKAHPGYHARPVAPFGPRHAELLVVGLAPGMHGANRTGRPFTGDHAGVLLYKTLHQFGFASHEGSAPPTLRGDTSPRAPLKRGSHGESRDYRYDDPHDSLKLAGCRVTNAVKCLPPANKPAPDEVRRCNRFLAGEIAYVRPKAVLALGAVAHRAVLMASGLAPGRYRFAHGATHELPGTTASPQGARLFDSYHCSRYNTQTRRLTAAMFEAVFHDIVIYLRGAR